jgi:hypothetical protein
MLPLRLHSYSSSLSPSDKEEDKNPASTEQAKARKLPQEPKTWKKMWKKTKKDNANASEDVNFPTLQKLHLLKPEPYQLTFNYST